LQDEAEHLVTIIHQFHPLFGRQFELAVHQNHWGKDRVFFLDDHKHLRSVPAAWTNAVTADPFVVISAGRSWFRAEDLLELVLMVRELLK
jgi:hypothetical protein